MNIDILTQKIVAEDRLAVAKAISMVENERDGYIRLLDALYPHTGNAYRIGITGPPGSGKSTLTSQLIKKLRIKKLKVGVIAVDPTSPYSGGAILGDRVRMIEHTQDKGVFIRSMATRGSLGGLARQASESADIMDAAGFDILIFETVGVGQVELDIAKAADTTLVLIVPEGGDMIQGMKAGLMEIGDLFILNKADRPGAERMLKDLEYVLHLKERKVDWDLHVLKATAHQGKGIDQIWERIEHHKRYLNENGLYNHLRKQRLKERIEMIIDHKFRQFFWSEERRSALKKYLEDEKEYVSPYSLAEKLFKDLSGRTYAG